MTCRRGETTLSGMTGRESTDALFSRAPGFTTVIVLTLEFGIGASIALFRVLDAVMLHRLPFGIRRSPFPLNLAAARA